MTSIERTAYPRLKRYYTSHELHQIYTPTLSEQKMGLTHGTGENHYCWLMSLGEVSVYLKHLTRTKVKHFASEARNLDAASVKDLNLAKQITIVLCLIHKAQVDSHDDLVEMFLKRIGTIHKKGKEKLDSLRQEQQSTSERLLSTFQEVLQVLSDEEKPSSSEELLQSVQAKLNESGGVEELLNQCETLTAYKGNNYYPLLWHFYKSHRSVFFRLIQALEFESTTSDQRLINALQFLRENEGRRGEWLIGKLDLSFASNGT